MKTGGRHETLMHYFSWLLATGMAVSVNLNFLRAAETRIPFTAERWEASGKVDFIEHRGVPAARLAPGVEQLALKDFSFENGTIELDIEPARRDFIGLYFRFHDLRDTECVYLRTGRAGDPAAGDAVQYAPLVKGVNLWDLLGHYQGPATIHSNAWNHVKLVVSGARLRVYVNRADRPTLDVPCLEGSPGAGTLSLFGAATFANLVVRPNEVESLPAGPGVDPVAGDPRYLRSWQVSETFALPKPGELTDADFPKAGATWAALTAERRGLLNLTRRFGKNPSRRAVWLRTTLKSAVAQSKDLRLGWSDEIWVFLNGQPVYAGKNLFGQPSMKAPAGRCALENGGCSLPLKAGENELLVGVANDFYGWGLIGRLADTTDLSLPEVH